MPGSEDALRDGGRCRQRAGRAPGSARASPAQRRCSGRGEGEDACAARPQEPGTRTEPSPPLAQGPGPHHPPHGPAAPRHLAGVRARGQQGALGLQPHVAGRSAALCACPPARGFRPRLAAPWGFRLGPAGSASPLVCLSHPLPLPSWPHTRALLSTCPRMQTSGGERQSHLPRLEGCQSEGEEGPPLLR